MKSNRSVTRLNFQKKSKYAKFQSRFSYLRGSRFSQTPGSEDSGENILPQYQLVETSEHIKVWFLVFFGLTLIWLAFFFNTPSELWAGSIKILTSPANLLTDYIELTNLGSTFLNAGMMTLLSVAMIKVAHSEVTGVIVAAVFTVTGFSFFGKNLFNSVPIVLGVILYSKISRVSFKKNLPQALFGTALGPLVSEIAFNLNILISLSLILGFLTGVFVGVILTPLSIHMRGFHLGFNLYNLGFTAGIIGTIFIAIFRSEGVDVLPVSVLSSGNNKPLSSVLFVMFAIMFLLGILCNNRSFKGYKQILSMAGKHGTDFVKSVGFGVSLINMSILGLLMTGYVLLMKGEINGPVIGSIFTVFGFGAAGKNLKNVLPIMFGVLLAIISNIHEASSTIGILSAIFGTTLAPIAGYYGAGWGTVAGFLHMAIAMNIGYLHGGMNLYNNGFSGGFVAAALVPLIDNLLVLRVNRANKVAKNR